MRNWSSIPALLIALSASEPAHALELGLPAACKLGQDCHLMQIADRDPGPEATDFSCGGLTYDGHKGTDIGLSSWREMFEGVDVIAAAPGRVLRLRDGMADRPGYREPNGDITGRDCGNGLVLDHGEGWTTQYCHLAQGSVAVSEGDTVERGQRLGRIGASGRADFPHVHLTLRKGSDGIDPFDGRLAGDPCGGATAPVWAPEAEITYSHGGVLSAGFVDRIPAYGEIWNEAPTLGLMSAEADLVFWAHFYGLRQDDALEVRITGPDGGEVVSGTHVMEKNRATEFRAVGRRVPSGGWPSGTYAARAQLIRDRDVVAQIEGTTTIP